MKALANFFFKKKLIWKNYFGYYIRFDNERNRFIKMFLTSKTANDVHQKRNTAAKKNTSYVKSLSTWRQMTKMQMQCQPSEPPPHTCHSLSISKPAANQQYIQTQYHNTIQLRFSPYFLTQIHKNKYPSLESFKCASA